MTQSQNSQTWTLLIEGLVQGVGYRRFARWSAKKQGLTGWTRNLSDGRVEVRVSGPVEAFELYLAELKQGPRNGSVKVIEVQPIPFESFNDFRINESH